MTKRNPAIELLRIVLMFGICWLHCSSQGGAFRETKCLYYLLRPCVVGFVFISGYFGMRFSWRKIAKLVLLCVWCAACSLIIKNLADGSARWFDFGKDLIFAVAHGYWFVWSYILLMMVAPILDKSVEGDANEVNQRICPLLVAVFGWSAFRHFSWGADILPASSGLDHLSVISFSAIYLVARIVRQRGYDVQLSPCQALSIMGGCAVFCVMGLSHYDSIFCLLISVALFSLARRIMLPSWVSRLVLFVSPSMLAVYLLHQTNGGFSFITSSQIMVANIRPAFIRTFISALIVFFACVAFDMLRRCIWCLAHSILRKNK